MDKHFKSLERDDRTYEVALINSNGLEPQDFASYSLEENPVTSEVKPQIQDANNSSEQDADKSIKKLKDDIKQVTRVLRKGISMFCWRVYFNTYQIQTTNAYMSQIILDYTIVS